MKVTAGRFQYTAIDDCTRLRVLGVYPRRTASNAVHFLTHRMIEEFPFPIQRIQTDRGSDFFGDDVPRDPRTDTIDPQFTSIL
jgi:hypothetical protein